jgi:hypothetical protein
MTFTSIRKKFLQGVQQFVSEGMENAFRVASPRKRSSLSRHGKNQSLKIEQLEQRSLLSISSSVMYLPTQYSLNDWTGYLTAPSTAAPLDIATTYLKANASNLGLTEGDFNHFIVTDQYTDSPSGITHLYLRQEYNGLEVINANLAINITANGRIINVGGGFVPGLNSGTASAAQSANSSSQQNFIGPVLNLAYGATSPSLPAIAALDAAAAALELAVGGSAGSLTTVVSASGDESQSVVLTNTNYSLDDIPAKLHYVPTSNGQVTLAWDFILRTPDGDHWFDASTDSLGGRIVGLSDWVDHATYNVFPRPVENPDDGTRSIVTDPSDTTASPFGWHDTNGVAGAEHTDTRGNNVNAQEDRDADDTGGHRPDGGASLNFDYPIDLTKDPTTYEDAVITNLFYWNNILHDVHYKYGFTEASGNFQTMNYTGQGKGGDQVEADAQDGSGMDNANFGTPPDGMSGRMQMFLFDVTTPNRDGDLESVIMVHEFGHGVSNRLVGGPANANALDAIQSGGMGEGWSDWWSLMLTEKAPITQTTVKSVGTYVMGQPLDGPGIRRYPYSFDMTVNPLTYGDVSMNPEVHDEGEVWCQTLWDMTVLLEEKYSFDADISKGYSAGSAGNLLALQLVMDSLKLMPVNPSFIDGRDAMLLADQNLTGGKNAFQIWTAFARRGMGVSADDGGSGDSINVTEAFDMPVISQNADLSITKTHVGNFLPGDVGDTYTVIVSNIGEGATSGIVSVYDILPVGLTATGMSGDGWIVDMDNLTASRIDPLAAGASYPLLTVTVMVAVDAPSTVVNTVIVTVDGDQNLDNNSSSDLTTIGKFKIDNVSPDPSNGMINAGTSKIKIHFSSTAIGADNSTNYRLQAVGADGLLGTPDDEFIPFTLAYQDADPTEPLNPAKAHTASIVFSALPENVYRLTIDDAITDTAGMRFDGDNDGTPGDDWVTDFVAVPSTELLSGSANYPSFGANPISVAAGDFNGDNKPDLAVLNNPTNDLAPSIKIFLNDGKGNFIDGMAVTTGLSNPHAVIVDDFTGDHKNDLAVANYDNNTVTIYRGDGRGGFVLGTIANVGAYPINLVAGDFNGDGKRDIAVANYGAPDVSPKIPGTLGILTGSGNGAFTYRSFGIGSGNEEPRGLAIADFNRDGKSDIAMVNYGSNNVSIFRGDGFGGFSIQTTKSTYGSFSRSAAAGDLNGDGKPDLVVANYKSDNLSVFLGTGTGTLNDPTWIYTGTDDTNPLEHTDPVNIALADFDADGKLDIVVTNSVTNDIAIHRGNGSGGFAKPITFKTGTLNSAYGLAVADFNGDKRPDIAVTNVAPANVAPATNPDAYKGSVSVFKDFYGTPAVTLKSSHGSSFDVSIGSFGQGQFIEGSNDAFDGFGRLSINDLPFQMTSPGFTIPDSGPDIGQAVVTNTSLAGGLTVNRKITVPKTGADDFARTVDIFTNTTNTDIITTVKIVGNLGSDADTSIFATSSGDATLTTSDLWFATHGSKGQTLLYYLHGYAGLEPTSAELVGDNVVWTYTFTVPALQTRELGYFTVMLDDKNPTQAAAEQKAIALVTSTGFAGQAGLGLTSTDLSQLSNFQFFPATQSEPMNVVAHAWDQVGAEGLTLKRTADGLVHFYKTGTENDVVPPRLYSSITTLTITGRDGVDDILTVDLTGGNPTPAGGATFNGGAGGGNALLLITGPDDDVVNVTATQIANNSVALVNYTNTDSFGFDLGGGMNRLMLSNVMLNLNRDNAISSDTKVTVDGGSLNFNGHTASLDTLVVTGGAHIDAANVKITTTTVTSGTLTATSITGDSLFIGPIAPPTILPDSYEENDTKAIVDARPEGGANSSNLGLITAERILSGLTMEDSADWYKFKLDATGTAKEFVRIDFTNSQGNLDMVLYGADGTTVVGSSASTGNSEIVSLSGLPAGTYYVKVYGYQGAKNPNYSLAILPLSADDYEDNDSKEIVDARTEGGTNSPNLGVIGSGRIISGLTMDDDTDWYKFKMDATGTAADVVRIDFMNSHGNLDMVVYRADGTTVQSTSAGVGNSEIVNLNGAPSGYYYVKVFGNQGAKNSNYTLSIAPVAPDRYEDNDTQAIVNARLEGAVNSPNLGLIMLKQTIAGLTMDDTADWYKFRLGAPGTAADAVQIDFINSHGNLDLAVYSVDGMTQFTPSVGTGDFEIVSLNGAPAGFYYVKVYGAQAATNPEYSLTFFPVTSDAYEENDSKAVTDARTEGAPNSPNLGTIIGKRVITGLAMEDSADWYKFKLAVAGTSSTFVQIDFAVSQGDLDMVVYKSDGTTIFGSSTSKGNSEIVSLDGAKAEDYYYIKVYGYQGAMNPQYSLTIMPISPDAYEVNDTPAIVDARPAGGTNSPNLGEIKERRIIKNLTMSDSADWYKFHLKNRGTPIDYLQLDFTNSQGNLDMILYEADGTTPVAFGFGVSDVELVSLYDVAPGDYYILVYGDQGASNPNYTLSLLPDVPDRYEDNDTEAASSSDLGDISTPTTIRYLTLEDGADWYKFHLGVTGLKNDCVQINFDNSLGNLDMTVYKANGTEVLKTSAGIGNSENVNLEGAAPGDYYIKVYAAAGVTNKYTLSLLPIFPDMYEENDTPDAAKVLGEITEKKTFPDLTMDDIADWYHFTTKDKGTADTAGNPNHYVQIDFPNSRGNLDLAVYKDLGEGELELWGYSRSDPQADTERVSLVDAEAGNYYVVVYGYYRVTNPDYTLTIVAPPPPTSAAASASTGLASAASELAASVAPSVATLPSLKFSPIAVGPNVFTASSDSDFDASKNLVSTSVVNEVKWNSATTAGVASSTTKLAAKAARLFDAENLDSLWGDLGLDKIIASHKPISQKHLHDAAFLDLDSWNRNI